MHAFSLSFALMYYAAGLLVWLISFVFAGDDFGYQSLTYHGRATVALVFVLATLWPLLLVALALSRLLKLRPASRVLTSTNLH